LPLYIRWVVLPKFFFFCAVLNNFHWPITKKIGTLEAHHNRRFYIHSSSYLAQLCKWKGENFGQNIWDENVMLLETSWGTHWELDGNNKPLSTQKKTPQ
jgi:hypothetical protein